MILPAFQCARARANVYCKPRLGNGKAKCQLGIKRDNNPKAQKIILFIALRLHAILLLVNNVTDTDGHERMNFLHYILPIYDKPFGEKTQKVASQTVVSLQATASQTLSWREFFKRGTLYVVHTGQTL